MEPVRAVSRDEFEGRKNVEDERFRRDKERLDEYQQTLSELTRISDRLTQIVDRHDKDISQQGKRIEMIEKQPADTWGKVKWAVMSSVITGAVGALLGVALSAMK